MSKLLEEQIQELKTVFNEIQIAGPIGEFVKMFTICAPKGSENVVKVEKI